MLNEEWRRIMKKGEFYGKFDYQGYILTGGAVECNTEYGLHQFHIA